MHLYDLIAPDSPPDVEREVIGQMMAIDGGFDGERLRRIYRDVVALFQGRYPGYCASDAWYHDLEHTNTVFLCMAAMLEGAHHEGVSVTSRGRLLGLVCALFHDIGLIRRASEPDQGTGARYTVGHEQRSIAFMEEYFDDHGFGGEEKRDGRDIILCTMLSQSVTRIPFRTDESRLLGQMLGSADVVAQMADRAYLEKLLLLFREFREAGLPGYGSELELLEKTPTFYRQVVCRRLEQELDESDRFLDAHARRRWGLDHEPYHRAIARNLDYLDRILEEDRFHYRHWLRRAGVIDSLRRSE